MYRLTEFERDSLRTTLCVMVGLVAGMLIAIR